MTKIRNESGDTTADVKQIKKISREYYDYHRPLGNLDEMHKLQERCKLPKQTQGEMKNLSKPIISKGTKLVF